MLAFDFMEKLQFVAKTDWNSIFLGCEYQIPDQLYIMVIYIHFYGFKKNQISAQNPKVLAFSFTEKCQFMAKK
jgi:hypothetical protein